MSTEWTNILEPILSILFLAACEKEQVEEIYSIFSPLDAAKSPTTLNDKLS